MQQHLSTELRDVVSEFDGSAEADADAAPPPSDPVPTLPRRSSPRRLMRRSSRIAPVHPRPAGGRRAPPRRPNPKPSLADNVCGHHRRPPPTPDPPRADPPPPGSRRPDDGGRAPVRAAPPAGDLHHRGRDRGHDHVHPVDGRHQLPRHVLQGRDRTAEGHADLHRAARRVRHPAEDRDLRRHRARVAGLALRALALHHPGAEPEGEALRGPVRPHVDRAVHPRRDRRAVHARAGARTSC